MATCPYCGSTVSFNAKFCQECGAPLPEVPVEQTEPAPYKPVSFPEEDAAPIPQPQPTPPPQQYNVPQRVPPISTGGLLAWSIITLFLCTIPGIVAIVKTVGINKATTVVEQQDRMSSARTWCIIGTVLGVLSLLGSLYSNGVI